jgi:hypothetical protein
MEVELTRDFCECNNEYCVFSLYVTHEDIEELDKLLKHIEIYPPIIRDLARNMIGEFEEAEK